MDGKEKINKLSSKSLKCFSLKVKKKIVYWLIRLFQVPPKIKVGTSWKR